jgi:type II secretory pathway component GspD/PulD (secretin)
VPLLGDIPLLGAAFKRKVKEDTKTELIIFLTPHILNLPSQMAALTESERSKSVLAPKAFSDQELDRFIDGLPVKKDTVPSVPTAPQSSPTGKKPKSPVMGKGMN